MVREPVASARGKNIRREYVRETLQGDFRGLFLGLGLSQHVPRSIDFSLLSV